MKKFTLVLAAVAVAASFTGCTSTTDGRSGLRGELCFAGYCLSPQAMTAASVSVPQTAVLSGPVVAPATVLSQPALVAQSQTSTYVEQRQPVAPHYPPPVFNAPPPYLEK